MFLLSFVPGPNLAGILSQVAYYEGYRGPHQYLVLFLTVGVSALLMGSWSAFRAWREFRRCNWIFWLSIFGALCPLLITAAIWLAHGVGS